MEKKPTLIIFTAIVCLAFLEAIALSNGINGVMLSIVIAAIAGLAGWTIPQPKIMKEAK